MIDAFKGERLSYGLCSFILVKLDSLVGQAEGFIFILPEVVARGLVIGLRSMRRTQFGGSLKGHLDKFPRESRLQSRGSRERWSEMHQQTFFFARPGVLQNELPKTEVRETFSPVLRQRWHGI